MKKITLFLVILLVGLFISSCTNSDSSSEPDSQSREDTAEAQTAEAPQEGKTAPDFQLENLQGEKVALSDLRGKPVLLVFWATT